MLIACDPSTKQPAFAIFDGENNKKLINFVKIDADFNAINKFFVEYTKSVIKGFIFGIETQYLQLNVLTVIKLVETRSLIATLAQVYKCSEIISVTPQSWQSIELGAGKNQKREQRKYLAKLVASAIAKQTITDSDIADAICIGDYLIKTKQYEL